MVSIVNLRELELLIREEGGVLIEYGYKWIAKYDSFIRRELYGHSVISFTIADYNPRFIIIPHFSFSSKKVNAVLDDVMQLRSDAVSDSIIFNLKHFEMQTEFEFVNNESSREKVKNIFEIVISKVIPLFNSIKSDFDIGEYVTSRERDISNVFSYMNAIAQHYEMIQYNPSVVTQEYFSPFRNREHDMKFIERYLAHIKQ